jgi:transposase InsO family protein
LYAGLVVGVVDEAAANRQLVIHAALMALWQRPARTPVIPHSDRGCQFTSEAYQRFLAAHQVIYSMSAVGSCADHAAAESFFGVLKENGCIGHTTGQELKPERISLTPSSAGTILGSDGNWNGSNRWRNS